MMIQKWRLRNKGSEFFMRMEWISLLSTVVEVKVVSVHCVLQSELTAGLVLQPSGNPEPAANIVHTELLQWLHVLRMQLTLPRQQSLQSQ